VVMTNILGFRYTLPQENEYPENNFNHSPQTLTFSIIYYFDGRFMF